MTADMPEDASLTICTVYHSENHKRLVRLNTEVTASLNPDFPVRWVIADNTAKGSPGGFDRPDVRVVRGLVQSELPSGIFPHIVGSFHHSYALNKIVATVNTRFLLVLDCDFYVTRHHWLAEALSHMKAHNLAFFGSTWHPKHYREYRYFPSVHCLFIDLQKIDKADLDFRPQAGICAEGKPDKLPVRKSPPDWKWLRILKRLAIAVTFRDRKIIGSSRDTGYALFQRFYRHPTLAYECIQAALVPHLHFSPMARMLYRPNSVVEKFLPDRLCFIPKDKSYYITVRFRDRGLFDVAGQGWEEYWWKQEPFAIHLRATLSKVGYKRNFEDDFGLIKKALGGFMSSGSQPRF